MATDDKISGMIFPADDKAKVSSNDSQTGFLASKLVAGANVTITENNNGANETLTISALGGVTGFTGSVNTAAPNNTVNASRLLVDVPTTDGDLVLQPKGAGAITAQLADGTVTGGNKRSLGALDFQRSRSTADKVAASINGAIFHGDHNMVAGQHNIIVSGASNTINGGGWNGYNVILGGSSNSITDNAGGAYSLIYGNSNALTASSGHNVIFGREHSINQGSYLFVTGLQNTLPAGGCYAGMVTGWTAAGPPTYVARAHGGYRFATAGDNQHEEHMLQAITTNNVAMEMGAVFYPASSMSTRINVASNSTYTFCGIITARRASVGNESAGWEIKGIIQNSGGTTAFVGTPTVTLLGASAGASTWAIAVTANDTNDNLRIDATGETGKTIRWGAYINLMKVAG